MTDAIRKHAAEMQAWDDSLDDMSGIGWPEIVRRVLETVRQPTPDMVYEGDRWLASGQSEHVWDAMIDALLGKKP